MCLKEVFMTPTNIDGTPNPNGKLYGYKAYYEDNHSGFKPTTVGGDKARDLPLNEWLTAEGTEILSVHSNSYYKSGFHIFLKKEHAEKYSIKGSRAIFLVQFKDVVGFGTNKTTRGGAYPTAIARKMKILKKVS
jgi:hypothetical protein